MVHAFRIFFITFVVFTGVLNFSQSQPVDNDCSPTTEEIPTTEHEINESPKFEDRMLLKTTAFGDGGKHRITGKFVKPLRNAMHQIVAVFHDLLNQMKTTPAPPPLTHRALVDKPFRVIYATCDSWKRMIIRCRKFGGITCPNKRALREMESIFKRKCLHVPLEDSLFF